MSAALDLYARLTETSDDKERARLIADAFDALEARFPRLNDLATQSDVRESELRLQKEIKELEAEIRKIDRKIDAEIKKIEAEIKQVEARLQLQIKEVDVRMQEMEARLQERIARIEVSLHQAIAAQTRWMIGGLAIVGVILKLADVLITP